MKCPVCKKIIPKTTLKCPYCNTRTGILCKNCNTINPLGQLTCIKCKNEILKICPHCNSFNLPNSQVCRKCGESLLTTFTPTEKKDREEPVYNPKRLTQSEAIRLLTETFTDKTKKIISLTGEQGIGKNYVLREAIKNLQSSSDIILFGKCTQLTQLTPGGVMQDIILNLFNLPNFCTDINAFRKNSIDFFQSEFKEFTISDIDRLISFLYPHQDGDFEDLFDNKNLMFNIFYKIFNKISQMNNVIIILDNFDLIDGFSYEFLNLLLRNQKLFPKIQILILSSTIKPAKSYFNQNTENVYCDITLSTLTKEETDNFCQIFQNVFSYVNDKESQTIFTKSKGNPAFLEQALAYCFDCQMGDTTFNLPDSFEDLIKTRLLTLKKNNPSSYTLLLGAAILGDKVNFSFLKTVLSVQDKQFEENIEYLGKMLFITPVNDIFFEFKNLLLWETILKTLKNTPEFLELNRKIYQALQNFVLNSKAIEGVISQTLKQIKISLKLWTENANFASYVGDVNLYVIAQKQTLALLNELNENENEEFKLKCDIYEKLGKILSSYNPKDAIEFLTRAVANIEFEKNDIKEIELLSYLSLCCVKTKNFYGNLECINNVLKKVPAENKLQIAILKALKLNSLLNIGNCGEIINLADNDIIPVLDKFLSKPYKINFSYNFIWDIWLKTYLYLANALVLQGNDRAFEVLAIVFDILEQNKIKDKTIIAKSKLILAFANTIKGDTYTSDVILRDILVLYENESLTNEMTLQLSLIKIFNQFLQKKYENLQEKLFDIVTLANNCDNQYFKNILKTLLGKLFKDKGKMPQALNIYNEQITYFAKEKMGLGALLTWYFIAEITLETESPHAAIEIAEQALSVAQNPKINNHIFNILLMTVIIRANIIINDYETAKIHLENTVTMAKQFNLTYLLTNLYMIYGKYYHEMGLLKTDAQISYLTAAFQMYAKATKTANEIKNNNILDEITTAKQELISFCRLNNLNINS